MFRRIWLSAVLYSSRARSLAILYGAQIISVAPLLLALWLILTYRGSDKILTVFNRIDGNVYPIASALLLLVSAGFCVTGFNLFAYLVGVWREISRSGAQSHGHGWRVASFCGLISILALLVIYGVLFVLTMLGRIRSGEGQPWMTDLLSVGQAIAGISFLVFLAVDIFMYRSQMIRKDELQQRLAIAASEKHPDLDMAIQENENDLSLSRRSIFLIDIPVILLNAFGLLLAGSFRTNENFQRFRDMQFPSHLVLRKLDPVTFQLAIYGLEVGLLAATLVVSQFAFASLLISWKYKDERLKQ